MKNITCTIIAFGKTLHLHVGYEPIIKPKDAKLITQFKVSDVYLHFDSIHSLTKI